MEQDGGLSGLAHKVKARARSGPGGLPGARTGELPIAAASDAHGSKEVLAYSARSL